MAPSFHAADHGHPKDRTPGSRLKRRNAPARRIALWITFVLLLVAEIYGFATTGILGQTLWSPVGISRLAAFAAGYAILAGLIVKWHPRLCVPVLLLLAVLWTGLAAGVVPLVVVLMFLLASWLLGALLFGRYIVTTEPLDQILLLTLGIGIYSFVQGLLAHFSVNTAVSAILLLAMPFAVRPKLTAASLPQLGNALRALATPGWKTQSALAFMGFPFVAHWLGALKPEVSTDALAMHLVIPSFMKFHHYWGFDFQQTLWSVMPMGGDWVYSLVYLIGGEPATRLVNVGLLCTIGALTFLISRRHLPIWGAATLTGLFVSTPLVHMVTGSLFVENFWTAMVIGAYAAILRFHETRRVAGLYASAILLGVAISGKLGAFAFAAPLIAVACWVTWRHFSHSLARTARLIFAFLGLLIIFAAQPYATAWIMTGNPVFPFLNNVFPTPYFESTWSFRDVRFEWPADWRLLYDLTFHTRRYLEAQAGAAGFQYLLLLPLCLIGAWGCGYVGITAIVCVALGSWITFLPMTNLRYDYVAMPLLTIAAAAVLGRCRNESRRFYAFVMTICVLVGVVNIYFLPAANSFHRDFLLNPLNAEAGEYVDRYAPVRKLIDHLNGVAPGKSVLFVGTVQIAGLEGLALTSTWHNRPAAMRLETATTPQQVLQIAQDFKLQYFVAPVPELHAISLPAFTPFLEIFTEPEYTNGSFRISKLKKEFEGDAGMTYARDNHVGERVVMLPAPQLRTAASALGPGNYDGLDARLIYYGRWEHSDEYPQAAGSSISYSNVFGAGLEFSFSGTEMTYVYTRAYNRGKASVRIDDVDAGVIDLYVPQLEWQNRRTWSDLSPGVHRVEIRVLPEKNVASEGFYIDVDSILVR